MKWTDKQEQAFSLRNREVLVSAAAGSGKTAVMVERILKLVTEEEPYIDIDRLLIVTFTKKAAESMRVKIRKELEKRLKNDPSNEHLQRQMLLINHAHISTIDSFCSFVVRNYFYLAQDVSSNYRIGDESEIKLLEEDVLKEVLELEYQKATDEFINFVDYFATGKNDMPLESVIKSLYKYSQSHEAPVKWLESCKAVYENFDINSDFLEKTIKSIIENTVLNAIQICKNALKSVNEPDGPYMYYDNFQSDIEILEKILGAGDLENILNIIREIKFSRLSAKKDAAVSDELRELCKLQRDLVKKQISELKETFAYGELSVITDDVYKCVEPAKELVRITKLYSEKLLSKKKEKNVFDHGDVAHIALEILKDKDNEISPAKEQLSKLFEEIFIDEYQDSNRLQEELLYSIAKEIGGCRRVFMVGDVKQSIYSFRMACPDIFIGKLDTFTEEEGSRQKVFLSHNFRSRMQVIESVNYVFEKLMNRNVSGISYDESQKLKYAASFSPEKDDAYSAEVLCFEKNDDDIDAYEAEAYMIGDRIKELIYGKNPLYIADRATGERRKAEYKDICIIVRTQKDVVAPIKHVLMEEFGIPVSTMSKDSFFEAFEVNLAINYLKILDNPYQDYPLTSVLLSPIAGLSSSELSKVRLLNRDAGIYEIVSEAVKSDSISKDIIEKLEAFLKVFNRLRKKISYTPVHQLIWEVYESTGLEAFVAAMPAGEHRVNNLKKLVNRAVLYENTNYKSLFDFLRYIEKIIEYDIRFDESDSSADTENAVKIMTMHKSKGLEFPVVFLAGLTKGFNFTDERATVLLHPELGIGFDAVDVEKRIRSKSLIKRLINKQIHIDKFGEEIRILYVAMTRAEEKLIITCCHDEQDGISPANNFNYFDILKAKNYWDWLKKIIDDENGLFSIRQYSYADIVNIHEKNKLECDTQSGLGIDELIYDSKLNEKLMERFEYVYDSKLDDSFKKISVSFLKEAYKFSTEEGDFKDSTELIEEEVEFPLLPKFIQEKEGITGAQRGVVYHSVLEHWDYTLDTDEGSVSQFIISLYEREILGDEEIKIINPKKLAAFLNSDLGLRMKEAYINDALEREASFTVILDSKDPGFEFIDSDVLLQGIIDAYFNEGNELVIVDYKTDYLPDGDLNFLIEKYAMQLKCYKYALEKITGKSVKEVWIYSLYSDKAVKVEV